MAAGEGQSKNSNTKGTKNMSDSSSSASGGVGFTGLLTIAFIVLKLCGVIAWSWLWVLSPLWISLAVALVVLAVVLLVMAVRR